MKELGYLIVWVLVITLLITQGKKGGWARRIGWALLVIFIILFIVGLVIGFTKGSH